MMIQESFSFPAAHGDSLPAVLWLPDAAPRMIVQIAHGMTEHIGRFSPLAEFLTESGIAVIGFDLRGHGHNPGNPQFVSMSESGWQDSLQDIRALSGLVQQRFPGIPHALLGFSLGSFLVRDYLAQAREPLCGVILMGTGNQPSVVLTLLKALVRTQIRRAGFEASTPLVRRLSFETYNQNFKPNRTEADWLCADAAELDAYLSDPLCRPGISAGLFWMLLDSMQRTGAADFAARWPRNLPVLLLSGAEDPVGNCGKGVEAVRRQLAASGICVQQKLIPAARHDVLHEEVSGGAAAARAEIRRFLQSL